MAEPGDTYQNWKCIMCQKTHSRICALYYLDPIYILFEYTSCLFIKIFVEISDSFWVPSSEWPRDSSTNVRNLGNGWRSHQVGAYAPPVHLPPGASAADFAKAW